MTRLLSVYLLGGLRVMADGNEVPASAWQYRNSARTLLKVLALQPDHRLHREQVVDILWPESDVDAASARLRKSLHALRHALEPDLPPRAPSRFLTTDNQLLQLSSAAVWIDVDAFQTQAAVGLSSGRTDDLEAALNTYGGELLPEDRYEDWAAVKREELLRLRRELSLRLATVQEGRGELGPAAELIRRLIDVDPTDEEATRLLMRLYMRSGNRHAALLAYRRCRDATTAELDIEPSPETQQLHDELLSGMVQPSAEAAASHLIVPHQVSREQTPLVGRTEILGRTQAVIQAALEGLGGLILLGGEPGAGKTRLAVEVAREAISRGAIVLWGSAFEEENLLPYSVFADLLANRVGSLSPDLRSRFLRDYPELQPLLGIHDEAPTTHGALAAGQVERARIQRGISRFLTDLAASVPVVIVLDDLHHADPASLAMLVALARAAGHLPWLLIATFREEAVSLKPDFGEIIHNCSRAGALRIDVGGLNQRESRLLASTLLGMNGQHENGNQGPIPVALQEDLFERSRGNPLFLTELANMVRGGELADWQEHLEGSIPRGVRELIAQRARRLSPLCRRGLSLGAAAGTQWTFQVINRVAEQLDPPLPESALLEAIDEGLQNRILEEMEVGPSWGYGFRHPLIQACFYESLSSPRRCRLHGLLGQTIEALSPDEVEVLAHHFSRSDDSERAILYLQAASERALSLYANEAAYSYLSQLEKRFQDQRDSTALYRVRLKLGRLLMTLSRYDDALAVLARISSEFDTLDSETEVTEVAALIAEIEGARARPEAGIERIRPLLAPAEARSDPKELLNLYSVLAKLHFLASDYLESLSAGQRMRALALQQDDKAAQMLNLGRAASCIGVAELMLGRWESACATLAEAIQFSQSANDLEVLGRSLNNLGSAYADAGMFAEAVEHLQRALETARKVGDLATVGWQMSTLANVRCMLGDWEAAEDLVRDAAEVLASLDSSWFSAYPLVQRAHVALLRGDVDLASEMMSRARPLIESSGDLQVSRWAQAVLARLDLDRREPEAAVERLQSVLDRPGLEEADVTFILPLLAEALLEVDIEQARELAERAAQRARDHRDKVALVDAIYVRGLVAMQQSQLDTAEATMLELWDLADSMSYPYAKAQASLALAEIGMMQEGPLASDVAHRLREAQALFSHLGAKPYLDRTRTLQAQAMAARAQ